MSDWRSAALQALASEPVALVTVLATEGSAPRGPGTRMLVTGGTLTGTIGGGRLEYQAAEQARAILSLPPGEWRVQDWPLGPLLGQCCGGRVRLLIERLDPDDTGWMAEDVQRPFLIHRLERGRIVRRLVATARPTPLSARGNRPEPGSEFAERLDTDHLPLFLFGAGHVGQAIARRLPGLPLTLGWFDTRPETGDTDGVTVVDESGIEQCVADAPSGTAFVVLTHDHALDYRLTAAALRRADATFTGLIGSATKRARFLSRLERDGIDAAARTRLTCPIGMPGIAGKEPDVIAIAVIAQLLALPRIAVSERAAA